MDTTLSREQLAVRTDWVVSGRVRMHRRVVSQTQTIEVVVRREELVIETVDVETIDAESVDGGERYRGATLDGPPVPGPVASSSEPLVILLREEVPEVVTRSQVYERVTAHVDTVVETVEWRDTVRHEQIATDEAAPAD